MVFLFLPRTVNGRSYGIDIDVFVGKVGGHGKPCPYFLFPRIAALGFILCFTA